MLITLKPEVWKEILTISELINTSREKINAVWEAAAEEGKFIAASVRVVDTDKGVIDAEPRPSPEYVKQKQILMYADGLRSLDADVRDSAVKLAATVTPKLDLANMLQLVQEGHSAEDAFKAEPVDVEEAEADAALAEMDTESAPN